MDQPKSEGSAVITPHRNAMEIAVMKAEIVNLKANHKLLIAVGFLNLIGVIGTFLTVLISIGG